MTCKPSRTSSRSCRRRSRPPSVPSRPGSRRGVPYRRAIAAASATIPTCRGTTRSRASARSGRIISRGRCASTNPASDAATIRQWPRWSRRSPTPISPPSPTISPIGAESGRRGRVADRNRMGASRPAREGRRRGRRRRDRQPRTGRTMIAFRKLFAFAATGLAIAFTAPALAQQTVKVGSTPTGIPFTFLDTQSNTIQGVMVDIITAIGKDAGFSVQVEPMQFSTLIGALTSNRIDVVAAMYITEPRKQVIDFSDPIYTYGDGLFVPKADTKEYKTLEDLKGLTVGAQVGTAYVEPLQKSGFFPEVKIYDTLPDIIRDVNAGRLKAGFADYPIVAYNLQQGRFPDVRLVSGYKPMVVGSVGIGVRKSDQELLKKINASLAKIKADGTLKQILAKWGLQD